MTQASFTFKSQQQYGFVSYVFVFKKDTGEAIPTFKQNFLSKKKFILKIMPQYSNKKYYFFIEKRK